MPDYSKSLLPHDWELDFQKRLKAFKERLSPDDRKEFEHLRKMSFAEGAHSFKALIMTIEHVPLMEAEAYVVTHSDNLDGG